MNANPLISVIIPTYNRAEKLKDAVKSALNQSYSPVQLIVVDDGSTDDTATVVKNFSGVQYLYQKNSGQAAARNLGLSIAKGEYIASLDSDDTWEPDFLTTLAGKLEKDHLDFVFANWWQKAADGTRRDYLRTYPRLAPLLKNIRNGWIDLPYPELRSVYLAGCPSPSSSALIRKSSFISNWDPHLHIGDDWCLFLDMILNKPCRVSFCMENLWIKNIEDNNIFDGRAWNEVTELLYVKDLKYLIKKYRSLLTSAEIRILEKCHLENTLVLAFYKLLKNHQLSEANQLIRQSFQIGLWPTLRALPYSIKNGLNRKLKTLNAQSTL